MKTTKLLLYILMAGLMVFTSCKKDDEDVNEAQVLVEYLESADSPYGKDYVNTDLPSVMPASDVKILNETGQVYIIDIRSAADFAAGHIANAHNVALADILTHVEGIDMNSYEKVAVVCYTGQTAGFATSLLRLMGYSKVFSMKWGMCAWHEFFATNRWPVKIGNAYASQFTGTSTDKNATGNLPTLNTGKTTGQEILEARVNALLAEGYSPAATVDNATLFGNLNGYYIVNYWPAGEYADPGHVPGAVQYTPKETLKLDVDLKTLPTNKPIAVYCYTGQTSSFLAAYLRLIGYDAKSLLYGANGMIYNEMVAAGMTEKKVVWTAAEIKGYEYVTSK